VLQSLSCAGMASLLSSICSSLRPAILLPPQPRGVARAASVGAAPAAAASAEELAARLVTAVVADDSALYSGSITRTIDPRAGVLRLGSGGTATQLLSQAQLTHTSTMAAGVRAAAEAAAGRHEARSAAVAALAARTRNFSLAAAAEEAAWWREYGNRGSTLGALVAGTLFPTLTFAMLLLPVLALHYGQRRGWLRVHDTADGCVDMEGACAFCAEMHMKGAGACSKGGTTAAFASSRTPAAATAGAAWWSLPRKQQEDPAETVWWSSANRKP